MAPLRRDGQRTTPLHLVLRGRDPEGSWVGPGSRLMARLLQPNSSNDNIQSITSGDWDVTKILSYDEKRNKM